jgi:hypothetical protein
MKKLFKPRTETIEFKTFCSSGSPEFVAAKKKVNDLFKEHQKNSSINRRTLTAYSLYINPLAFFDIHFLIAAGCVVLVAVLEKKFSRVWFYSCSHFKIRGVLIT